ncbi:hypothetical protein MNV49_005769 [Pseudohyphozyma bogoriensis]|nr:hypothetical protein MNV49_005769 [Pseudohyphozyma bogoriensis]
MVHLSLTALTLLAVAVVRVASSPIEFALPDSNAARLARGLPVKAPANFVRRDSGGVLRTLPDIERRGGGGGGGGGGGHHHPKPPKPSCKPLKGHCGKIRVKGEDGTDYGWISSTLDSTSQGPGSYSTTTSRSHALEVNLEFHGGQSFNIRASSPALPHFPYVGGSSTSKHLGHGSSAFVLIRATTVSPGGTYKKADDKSGPRHAESQIWTIRCHELGLKWTNKDLSQVSGDFFIAHPGSDDEYIGATADWGAFVAEHGSHHFKLVELVFNSN